MESKLALTLDFVKALLWPCVAFIALMIFYAPVNNIVLSVSKRADQIDVIKLGSLELNIAKSELPKAQEDVAKVLTDLDEEAIRLLMVTGPDIPTQICLSKDEMNPTVQTIAAQLLEARGAYDVNESRSDSCEKGLTLRLTSTGKAARNFVFKLVTGQFKSATPPSNQ